MPSVGRILRDGPILARRPPKSTTTTKPLTGVWASSLTKAISGGRSLGLDDSADCDKSEASRHCELHRPNRFGKIYVDILYGQVLKLTG